MLSKDKVIDEILNKISKSLKKKYNIDTSKALLFKAINTQYECVANAMLNVESIFLPSFGTFRPSRTDKAKEIAKVKKPSKRIELDGIVIRSYLLAKARKLNLIK